MANSQRIDFRKTIFNEIWLFNQKPVCDKRGYFSRLYCFDEFSTIGLTQPITQINYSLTKEKGTVRGFHYQLPPYAETKVIFCKKGKMFDVVVDIRSGSETFLEWYGVELSADNQTGVVIPPGFAHGFQTLEIDTEILYLVTEKFNPMAEMGLNPLDPAISVAWPIAPSEMSEKDRVRPLIDKNAYGGVFVEKS